MTPEQLQAIRERVANFDWSGLGHTKSQMESLLEYVERLQAELETERRRVAGCGVAAMQNTNDSIRDRITPDNPNYSASYGDVCATVDREMALRAERDALKAEVERLKVDYEHRICDGCTKGEETLCKTIDAYNRLQAKLKDAEDQVVLLKIELGKPYDKVDILFENNRKLQAKLQDATAALEVYSDREEWTIDAIEVGNNRHGYSTLARETLARIQAEEG